jgi:hypothetical protein
VGVGILDVRFWILDFGHSTFNFRHSTCVGQHQDSFFTRQEQGIAAAAGKEFHLWVRLASIGLKSQGHFAIAFHRLRLGCAL